MEDSERKDPVRSSETKFSQRRTIMYTKLTCLVFFVLALSVALAGTTRAELVGWWRFDEGSGTVASDSSTNGNDGSLNGNPKWVAGHLGGALEFDGSGDYVDCGTDQSLDLTKWTVAFWLKANENKNYNGFVIKGLDAAENFEVLGFADGSFHFPIIFTDGTRTYVNTSVGVIVPGEWAHFAYSYDSTEGREFYKNGSLIFSDSESKTPRASTASLTIGNEQPMSRYVNGAMDDVRIYNHALTDAEILAAMEGSKGYPYALGPKPADGAIHADTWVSLSWRPGDFAVSHDVYLGDNFNDVNGGTHASGTFRGNQIGTFYVAGFPGFAYPDGLVPGTTYYWRIDEINEADPNSPWKGDVWRFSIPPKTAYNPSPADGAESVAVDVKLSWTVGFRAKLHTIYFGDNFDTVANAAGGVPQGLATYNPGPLKWAKIYYWRVDEFDGVATYKGDVWSFTTQGAVGNPSPANGAVDVKQTPVLSWTAGAYAASHEVYLGADAEAVKNATKASPEYKGSKALGDESYAPAKLAWETTYFWRIDEVNSIHPDSPWTGKVWSFTTAGFLVLDDFEDYSADDPIWWTWHDGLGYGAPGSPPYFAGNGTGSAVGDETTASTCEETIVHGGGQSMPLSYDNNKQGFAKYSEVERTFTASRDWTEEGIGELSIWFRGLPGSVGGFTEAPAGTYTMTASGTDIWDVGTAGNYHDEFHFAYKTLTGAGSIVARVQSVQNTNAWSKAGVMIRESLDGGSKHAFAAVTPSNGVASQGRDTTGAASFNTNQTGVAPPYWVKLERDAAGSFTVSHSANGTAWQPVTGATPRNIPMSSTVYVGLALTSHDAGLTCQAVFTNVTTTGTVSGQWAHQDIGIASNAAEPLYVAVSNAAGQPAVVVHPDAAAAQITTWTEWVIPLQSLTGVTLTNVDRLALGLGTRGNVTTPGGSGKMYFDDIRLYRPRTAP
jgi:hypothetical protein